ncbi:thermonuclease family protein [Cellvibrio fibrivorans]|uniref:Endonuclease YncB(Thermonuclease family) n=1 Tax=Cellvibrio fibrivorans TaxID=126350 RepID=A0ABU1UTS9_9GAMM|nr:thermonuclease family protein [Cellvibrio fibrivorans]MDR7088590.1 endonuclease YncB(thermonuclease family) [Cellvibrio fibrivorans]
MNALSSISLTVVLLFLTLPVSAQTTKLYGNVVGITDGDTITILTDDKRSIKVRLVEIDAPEKNQPWGQRSKQALSNLIFSLNVSVASHGEDRYGRTLGTVYLGDLNVNKQMVVKGNAWAYTQYVRDQDYFALQKNAESRKVGLWSLAQDQITEPWIWRKQKK